MKKKNQKNNPPRLVGNYLVTVWRIHSEHRENKSVSKVYVHTVIIPSLFLPLLISTSPKATIFPTRCFPKNSEETMQESGFPVQR